MRIVSHRRLVNFYIAEQAEAAKDMATQKLPWNVGTA